MPQALRNTDVYTGASTEFIGCSWLTLVEFKSLAAQQLLRIGEFNYRADAGN